MPDIPHTVSELEKLLPIGSMLEDELFWQIKVANLPLPERHVKLIPGRQFEHDFVWRKQKIAVEVQGGIWIQSGHSTGQGILRDCEKLNLVVLQGYKPLLVTKQMIADGRALNYIEELLKGD